MSQTLAFVDIARECEEYRRIDQHFGIVGAQFQCAMVSFLRFRAPPVVLVSPRERCMRQADVGIDLQGSVEICNGFSFDLFASGRVMISSWMPAEK